MGDYTDDTLVEYVIVLIRNGRQKEEVKKELTVFLGDDSDSFVSWLWDHLSLKMDLYAQPKESLTEEVVDRIVTTNDHFEKSIKEMAHITFASHTDFEQEGGKSVINVSRSSCNREWKEVVGAMNGSFPLRSTVIEALNSAEKTSERVDVRHLSPPRRLVSRKRSREDGWPPKKRDELLPKHAPSRWLLEFAVRDAVKTVQQSSSKGEPALKRLCSVVSSSADSLLDKRPQRPRSTLRMPGSVTVALKAAAEAAEDVRKSKNEGSVFNRLGRGKAIEPIDQSYNGKTSILQDATIKEFDHSAISYQVDSNQKDDYSEDFTRNSSILDRVADIAMDSASDSDGYDDFGISADHDVEASQCAHSVNKKDSSLRLNYNVSKDTDAVVKKMMLVPQEPPPTVSTNPSSKIVNISVNVNTWKPPDYQASRNVNEVEHQMGDNSERTTVIPNVHILKDNKSSITGNGKVHFGATKDNLSRHFNKFGEVLKVMIVTDPSTGQPIGSAYVEFLRKESAELALSLNGTSFMSRILKGLIHEEFTRILNAICGAKVTKPGRFRSSQDGYAMKSTLKAKDGLIYPLEKGFFFLPKPSTLILHDEVVT